MGKASLTGCLLRNNKHLMGKSSIPVSFECSGSAELTQYSDMINVVREAVELLNNFITTKLRLVDESYWEFSGRQFNLYSYELVGEGGIDAGMLRVIELSTHLLNVSGGLYLQTISQLKDEIREELHASGKYSEGKVMDITFNKEVWGEGYSPTQKLIPQLITYRAEPGGLTFNALDHIVIRSDGGLKKKLSVDDLIRSSYDLGEELFHCVTGWSAKLNGIKGLRLKEALRMTRLSISEGWLGFLSLDGYSTIIPAEEALKDEAYLVTHLGGEPLKLEHGYPIRVVLPRLFGWKSIKWLAEVISLRNYEDGYWETLSYHERGLVSAEERFKIRNPEIGPEDFITKEARMLKPKLVRP